MIKILVSEQGLLPDISGLNNKDLPIARGQQQRPLGQWTGLSLARSAQCCIVLKNDNLYVFKRSLFEYFQDAIENSIRFS